MAAVSIASLKVTTMLVLSGLPSEPVVGDTLTMVGAVGAAAVTVTVAVLVLEAAWLSVVLRVMVKVPAVV